MGKLLTILVVLLIVGVGVFLLFSGNDSNVTGEVIENSESVRTFVVDSSHLRFYIDGIENPDIKVKEGDKVRVEFTSSEGFHDWVLDEFSAATTKVNPGESSSVEFIADKKGTFEYYCSVGKHRANGMKGKFIVE